MSSLNIRKDDCQLDFLSLGALVHRMVMDYVCRLVQNNQSFQKKEAQID